MPTDSTTAFLQRLISGWRKGGIEKFPPIIARGVLIDVARHKGVDVLPESYGITVEDIQGTLRAQNVVLEDGDVVMVRTGRMRWFKDNDKYMHNTPGLTRASANFLADRGAIGAVQIGNPVDEAKYPWARGARNWAMPGMRLLGPDGQPVDAFPALRATASLGVHAARRLFEDAEMDADEVFARREAGTLEAFDLPGQASLAGRTTLARVTSHNVVGRLSGTDAALASEHIVYTAHLDHVGRGAEVDGDDIYNGAFDNALGTAVMLEAATELVATPAPKRTLLFVALTAEERGLLGAEHFASNPGVDGTLVANINMDMPVFLADVTDVVPIGIEHSSLENDVKAAAEVLGIGLTADPKPEEVVFVRSDQYAFVRKGIPAVYLDAGIKARSPDVDALALYEDFLTGHYHQPSDETSLPIHYPSAARLAMLNAAIGRRVGDAQQKPHWKDGDFFGRTFGAQ